MKTNLLSFCKTFLSLVLMLSFVSGWGQTVVTVGGGATVNCPATPTATPTATWTTPPTGVTFSNWSRGSGVTCATASTALSGQGFILTTATAGFTANAFYSVTITADATHNFSLDKIVWATQLSGTTNSCSFIIKYSNNGGVVSDFSTAQTISSSGTATNLTFSPSSAINVAAGTSIVLYLIPYNATAAGTTVRWSNGSTITVTASSALACPSVPTSLNTTGVTAIATNLNWTAPSLVPGNGYEYYYSTSSAAPTSGTLPTGTSGTTSATLNSLSPNTTYYWWVRSACNATDKGAWVAGSSFMTPQIPATLNYSEDFEGANNWTFVNGGQTNKWYIGSATAVANGGVKGMYISNDNGITNAYTNNSASVTHAYRDLTIQAGTTNLEVDFDWKATGEGTTTKYDYLRVWLVPSTWTPVAGTQITSAASGGVQIGGDMNQQTAFITYLNAAVNASAFAGTTARLIFEWRNDASGGTNPPAAIDNVIVKVPTCSVPTVLNSSAVVYNGATLSWTAPATVPGNGYEYYVSTTNTAPTAAGTTNASTSVTLSTLNPNTTYYWWVRSICSGTDQSTWVAGASFKTPLAPCVSPVASTALTLSPDATTPTTKIVGSFTASSPGASGYLIVRTTSSTPPSAGPVNGTTYSTGTSTANTTAFGTGANVLTGSTAANTTTSISDTGLTANTNYYYYVYAFNNNCTGTPFYSPVLSGTATTCIAAASGLTVGATPSLTGGNFSWTAPSFGGNAQPINYTLNVYTDSGYTTLVKSYNVGTGTTYTLDDAPTIQPRTTYYWRIVTSNTVSCTSTAAGGSFYTGSCNPPIVTNTSTYIHSFATSGGTSTNISNITSGFSTNGYANNYDSMSVTSYNTGAVNFSLSLVGGTAGIGVWVDWNNNLIFEASEKVNVYDSTNALVTTYAPDGTYTGTIAVPLGTVLGDYRMRVKIDYNNSTPDPCSISGTTKRSETEDYKFTVNTPPDYVVYTDAVGSVNDKLNIYLKDFDPTYNFYTGSEASIWMYAGVQTSGGTWQYVNTTSQDANNTGTLVKFDQVSTNPNVYKATLRFADYFCIPAGTTVQGINLIFRNQYSALGNDKTNDLFLDLTDAAVVVNVPTIAATTNITDVTATLNWKAPATGSVIGYDYYYSTSATAPTAGSIPNGSTASGTVSANISGLSPNATYYAWVRTKGCGSDVSAWSAATSFTIAQTPASLDYATDFEGATSNWALVNGTQTNKWFVGSAVNNGGSKSLYITNDGGISNAYTISPAASASVVQAYRELKIPAETTTVDINFDWKVQGESTFDFFNVWLAPASYTPVAGTKIVAGSGVVLLQGNLSLSSGSSFITSINNGVNVSVYAGSNMRLIFEWINDGSGGTQPPAAIDNVSVKKTCDAQITAVTNGTNCGPGTVNLTATGNSSTTGYKWYSAATGGTLLGTTSSGSWTTPSVSATTTYFVSATTATCESSIRTAVTATINPIPVVSITPTATTVCENTVTQLTANANSAGISTIGTATGSSAPGNTPYRQAIQNTNYSRVQYLISKTELNAAGIVNPGNITSLSFFVTTAGTGAMGTFNISMANTSTSTYTKYDNASTFTSVYSGSNVTPVSGENKYLFTTPFAWDGTSNILVNICHQGTGGTSSVVSVSTPTLQSTVSGSGSSQCTSTGGAAQADRPVISFEYNSPNSITWSPASNLFIDTNATIPYTTGNIASTVYAKISNTATYTATATNSVGCTSTATTTVNVDKIDWANLQWPQDGGAICQGSALATYGRVYKAGVTNAIGQGAGITVEFGYSNDDTDPSTWPSSNWSAATYLGDKDGLGTNDNDEYTYNFNPATSGTYYYAFRYKTGNCTWKYGGYSASGGGFWDGTNNVNGKVIVNPLVSSGTITGSNELFIGKTGNYISNGTPNGTWSSSNSSVAAVDNTGQVTAVTVGSAVISYTVNSGCGAPQSVDFPISVTDVTTWIGDSASGAWNYDVPTSSIKAAISGNYDTSVDGDFNSFNLTVNPGGVLKIAANGVVNIKNELTNNGTVTIENEGNLLQQTDNPTPANTGNITVKRNIKVGNNRTQYNYLGTPVNFAAGQTYYTIYPTTYVLYHNEANNKFYTSSGVNIPGRGLAVKEPTGSGAGTVTATYIGVPQNGAINFGIVNGNTADFNRGYNLLGNPYPSNIDLVKLYHINDGDSDANTQTTSPNISSTFYFWDNEVNGDVAQTQQGSNYQGQAYATFNALTGNNGTGTAAAGGYTTAPGSVGVKTPTNIVKIGQGFMAKSLQTNYSLLYNNSIRTSEIPPNDFLGRNVAQPDDRYWVQMITPANLTSHIAVVYFGAGKNSFGAEDSESKGGSDELYSMVESKKLAINGKSSFSNTDVVALGAKYFAGGTYRIALEGKEGIFANGQNIYLKDQQTGIITNLSEGEYTFTATAGESTGRFEIVYQPEVVLATDGVGKGGVQVYRDGNDFVVKALTEKITEIQVYDVSGRLIEQLQPNSLKVYLNSEKMSNGSYLLKITQGETTVVKKIIK